MFRKIVSNLSFSPALVGQLAFYAKRLRKEQATRRIGLVFVALALVVQGLAIFDPPQSANASTSNDFVSGGLGGSNDLNTKYMPAYNANTANLQDIMTGMGITREEITATTYSSWIIKDTISWGHNVRWAGSQGLSQVNIPDANGNTILPVYGMHLKWLDGYNTRLYGWVGYSAHAGWFAIMQICGNLVTTGVPTPVRPPAPVPVVVPKCEYTSTLLSNSPDCKACEGSPGIWYKDTNCIPNIVESKSSINTTQNNVDASTVTAVANDTIQYTLTAKNAGLASTTVPLSDDLKDVSEYATVLDPGGGTYDATTHVLTWPSITLAPNATETRTFMVKVLDPIPSTPVGASDQMSYDCKMQNGFGTTVVININCAAPKVVEETVAQLPHTGPTENLIFAGVVLAVVVYFYARSRQVAKEVRLIRRDLNAGAF